MCLPACRGPSDPEAGRQSPGRKPLPAWHGRRRYRRGQYPMRCHSRRSNATAARLARLLHKGAERSGSLCQIRCRHKDRASPGFLLSCRKLPALKTACGMPFPSLQFPPPVVDRAQAAQDAACSIATTSRLVCVALLARVRHSSNLG